MEPKIEITNLISPLVNTYKILSNEWKHLFDIGIREYLYSQTFKYFYTNTFIHRSKVKFYDVYYPIRISYQDIEIDFQAMSDVFDSYSCFTIVGSAGSGKSTLMRHIFLTCIKEKDKIPLLIELRNLNEYEGSIEKLIAEKILKSKIKPSDDTFKRALESGAFLFLLDGYDEIYSKKKQEIKRQLELFVDAYSNNLFLMTTRPGSGIEGFPRFFDFHICSLDSVDIDGFIEKLVDEVERRQRIMNVINDPKNSAYAAYLENPLLLSMFILAFESHPEIPSKMSTFYRNVFDTLYSKHDGITKNSFPRERLTKLQREDFEKVLNIFSYLTLHAGNYAFTYEHLVDAINLIKKNISFDFSVDDLISDLQTSISILVMDGFEYKFPHRSMQEYFAAQFISNLPTEKKKKAYENLTAALHSSGTDDNYNLWSLCYELDETSFLSNFIILQLGLFEKKLDKKTGSDLVISYFTILSACFFHSKTAVNKKDELQIARYETLVSSIIVFFQVFDFDELSDFPETSGASDKLYDFFIKNSIELDTLPIIENVFKEKELIDILLEHNIESMLLNHVQLVRNKIIEFEMDVKKAKKNIDELLDL